jgi:hypothetical protein
MGAYRHAITVGFITTIIMGVAYRVLPVFNGTSLYSNGLMRVSFFLILIGNIIRVGFQLGTGSQGKPVFAIMGISGYLEVVALAIFGYNIWRTLDYQQVPVSVSEHITQDSKVVDVLRRYPELREVMVDLGFSKLRNANMVNVIPGFISLKQACGVEGVDIHKVVARLNEALKSRR